MNHSKFKSGFTILELMIVVTIIAIFASISIAMLSDTRIGAKTAAFKSEIDTLIPSLISICHDRSIVAADLAGGTSYEAFASDPSDQDCGPNGNGEFSIDVESTNGAACDSVILTEHGAIYVPSGC